MRYLVCVLCAACLLLQSGCASRALPPPIEEANVRAQQLQRAQIAEQSGSGYRALSIYQALLADTPDDKEILQRAAELAERLGETPAAVQWYIKLSTLEPSVPAWRERQAMNQIQLGKLTEAKATLLQLTLSNPERWMPWSGLGLLSDIAGDYVTAVDYHQKAIERGYEQPMAYNNLGYSLLMAHHYPEAEAAFRKGLNYAPDNERLYNNLLIALAWQGRYDEAVQEGRTIFKEWIVDNNVGYIALQRGDYTTAIKMFEAALTASPSYYPKAAENLRRARLEKDRH